MDQKQINRIIHLYYFSYGMNKNYIDFVLTLLSLPPVTVAERSKACTVFARSKAGIVSSNPTQGMDLVFVYVCAFFCVCVQIETLQRADHPSKESHRLSLIKKLRKLSPMLQKREQAPKCGSSEEEKKLPLPLLLLLLLLLQLLV
jgi:hypothetical protein